MNNELPSLYLGNAGLKTGLRELSILGGNFRSTAQKLLLSACYHADTSSADWSGLQQVLQAMETYGSLAQSRQAEKWLSHHKIPCSRNTKGNLGSAKIKAWPADWLDTLAGNPWFQYGTKKTKAGPSVPDLKKSLASLAGDAIATMALDGLSLLDCLESLKSGILPALVEASTNRFVLKRLEALECASSLANIRQSVGQLANQEVNATWNESQIAAREKLEQIQLAEAAAAAAAAAAVAHGRQKFNDAIQEWEVAFATSQLEEQEQEEKPAAKPATRKPAARKAAARKPAARKAA